MTEQEQQPDLQTVQVVYKQENPGSTLGIIGFIWSLTICPPAGVVLGIISRGKSQKAKQPTTWGTASFVLGAIFTALWMVSLALAAAFGMFNFKTIQNDIYQVQTQSQSQSYDCSKIQGAAAIAACSACQTEVGAVWENGKCVRPQTQTQSQDCDKNGGLKSAVNSCAD